MRLQELFLVETTEEDRAILSLSSAISNYINSNFDNDYSDEKSYDDDYDDENGFDIGGDDDLPEIVGSIGQLFDTPLAVMNPIKIELQTDYGIRQRRKKDTDARIIKKPGEEDIMGLWYGGDRLLMVLNKDYLGTPKLKSVIVHELRHALDDFKSDFKANKLGGSYSIPKKKAYRKITNDPIHGNTSYLAEPAEINARFLQALDKITDQIPALAKYPQNQITIRAQRLLLRALESYQIAYLFPEKEKSKDYKQLLKRGMDYITKELAHIKSKK
jgi:hypothetical protein